LAGKVCWWVWTLLRDDRNGVDARCWRKFISGVR
jgi:hypothetical protein